MNDNAGTKHVALTEYDPSKEEERINERENSSNCEVLEPQQEAERECNS
jgi:hypothetical protein